MKKLFTLLAALLFLGGLMAQESSYYLRDRRGGWDPESLNPDRYLQWNEEDQEYQVEVYTENSLEFNIVVLDSENQITSSLGYSAIEASCAGIREREDDWFGVVCTGGGLTLKIKLNAEGTSVVVDCEYGCDNIITADYVLLFRENGDWDYENAVLMENTTASVTKPAGTYQFAVVPTVEYFGASGWDHKLGFGEVDHDCSSNYYREGEDSSVKVTLAEEGNINVTVNGSSLCVEGNFAGPEYYLVGSFSDWDLDQADPMYDNTYDNWLPAGTYEFKVVTPAIISGEDTNWTGALGYDALDPECSSENIQEGTNGNFKVTLAEGGDVTVTYLAGYVCVTGDFVIPSAPTITTWTIAGEEAIAGVLWNVEYTDNDMIESNGTWTLVKQNVVLTELRNYYYKVARNHSWEVSYPAEGNQTLAIYKRGTYNITYTWVPATSTLTAEATWMGWPTDIENADATTVRKLIENGQLVIIRDGKRYNAQGILVE